MARTTREGSTSRSANEIANICWLAPNPRYPKWHAERGIRDVTELNNGLQFGSINQSIFVKDGVLDVNALNESQDERVWGDVGVRMWNINHLEKLTDRFST